jgi:hypothetical protein
MAIRRRLRQVSDNSRRHLRKACQGRLHLEQLETRLAPAINFTNLASDMDSQLSNLVANLSALESASQTPLPILGQSLGAMATDVTNTVTNADGLLVKALNAAKNLISESDIQNAMFPILQPVLVGANGAPGPGDIQISNLVPSQGEIQITVHLGTSRQGGTLPTNFNLGLPGIPLRLRIRATSSRSRLGLTTTR